MCHRYHGNTVGGARNVKPRDLKTKAEIRKIVTVGARKLPARATTMSKETYYSVKRDLLQCQKRPTTVSKETY
jgi:hypothetical protein